MRSRWKYYQRKQSNESDIDEDDDVGGNSDNYADVHDDGVKSWPGQPGQIFCSIGKERSWLVCNWENIEKYWENIRKGGWLVCKVENIAKILRNIGKTLGKREVG